MRHVFRHLDNVLLRMLLKVGSETAVQETNELIKANLPFNTRTFVFVGERLPIARELYKYGLLREGRVVILVSYETLLQVVQ